MLNNNKVNTLAHFIADVLTCEQCHTANDLSYWNLRLVTNGTLIDAFHWETAKHPLQYENRDGILVLGRWTNQRKERIQVLRSQIITSFAANDDVYSNDHPLQLELDFGEEFKKEQGR